MRSSLPLWMAVLAGAAHAQVTVTGSLGYRDRLYSYAANGFTGVTENKPLRFVNFRIETTGGATLAQGTTSSTGTFTIVVPGLSVGQTFQVRILAETAGVRVVTPGGTLRDTLFSTFTATSANHNIGGLTSTLAADAFNILDACLEGFLHVETHLGRRLPQVTAFWGPGSTDGTYYTNNTIHLLGVSGDPDEFDDDVIIHEYGHHVAASISTQSQFSFGSHSFTQTLHKDLAYSEAFANAFLTAVRNAPTYCDTNGSICHTRWDAEGPTPFADTRFTEAGVTASFYDLIDAINENHDFYQNGHAAILQVVDSMDGVQYTTDLDMEDFYSRWGVVRGDQALIRSIFNFYRIITGDRTPPTITHTPVTTASAGQAIAIAATATDDVGVATVLLFYKATGAADYTSVAMTPGSGSSYSGLIPAAAVTSAGVQYYVEARDAVFNWRRSPNNATAPPTPHSITVSSLPGPTITAPAGGATITNSVITFTWGSVANADAFDFKVFNTSTGALVLKVSPLANQNSTVYTFRSGSYSLQMKSCVSGVCGPATTTVNFTVALGPVPTSAVTGVTCPVVNDAGQNRANCSWNAVANAHFYFINVVQPGAGPGGGALTVAGTQVGPTSASLLIPNGAASVLVQGCNGDGCGPSSPALGIVGGFANAAAPIISQPFSGSVVDAGTGAPLVVFAWSRVPGDNGTNTRYRLYVQDFSRNRPALDVLTTNNFYGAYFNPGTRYDALVIATPIAGGASVQGPAQSFVTRGRNPRSPVFAEPTTFGTVARNAAGLVRVAWTPIQNADGTITGRIYQYFIPGPGVSFSGVSTDTFLDLLAPPGAYSGVVRACNAGTSCTAASDLNWGPWNNASDGEGGPASFTVQ